MSDLDLLREATEVDDSEVRALRIRVMDEIGRRKRRVWLVWPAVAAAAVVALLVLVRWPVPEAGTTPIVVRAPGVPPIAIEKASKDLARTTEPGGPVRASMPVAQAAATVKGRRQVVIQLETADPDVVIYLVNSTGGGE